LAAATILVVVVGGAVLALDYWYMYFGPGSPTPGQDAVRDDGAVAVTLHFAVASLLVCLPAITGAFGLALAGRAWRAGPRRYAAWGFAGNCLGLVLYLAILLLFAFLCFGVFFFADISPLFYPQPLWERLPARGLTADEFIMFVLPPLIWIAALAGTGGSVRWYLRGVRRRGEGSSPGG
jgi:hypothetical protein